MNLRACFAASAGLGRLLDVGVRDAVHLVADDRPAGVDEGRPAVGDLAALDLDRGDLDEVGHLGSVPVVSTSTTTSSSPSATASANSRTEPVPGSRNGVLLALPTSFRSSSWMSMSGWRARWPKRMASAMTSSGRSLAPASTIMIASRVPETIRSSSESCELAVGRVDDELAADAADPHGADRAGERDLADRQRGRGGDGAEDVGLVLLVRREDRDHELDVVLVALGEERPDRAVGQARGEGRRLGGPRLALDEAARDLARGVHPLFELDGEREEVEARAGIATGWRCRAPWCRRSGR